MVRSFWTACVILTLAAGAYAFPERGSRNPKAPDVPAADSSSLETASTEITRADSVRTESSPAPAPAPRSTRTRAARNAGKERAPVPPERTVEQPSPVAAELPAPAPPPAVAQPQQPPAAEVKTAATPPSAVPELAADFPMMRSLGGIGIVLTLMIGGFFATRRFAPQLFQKPHAEKTLKIVETMQMGDKRSIAVVQVGEKRLLLGNTSSRITLLAVLESAPQDEATGRRPEATPIRAHASGGGFRNIFELEKRPAAPRSAGVPKAIAPDIRAKMRQLRESLEQ